MSEAFFTPGQIIPKVRIVQQESLFLYSGYCMTLVMQEYDSAESFCKYIVENIEGKKVEDLFALSTDEEERHYVGKRERRYQGKLVLLTDSGCASACETIIEKLETHPNAIVVGKNTRGALHYGNAATFMLPHSGILVHMPTRSEVYENDAPEGLGYTPDVVTDSVDLDSLFRQL